MGRPASHTFTHRGLTLDWMLVAVAVIAVALLFGTMIRTNGGSATDPGMTGGLFVLRGTDQLITFEDYTNDAPDGLDLPASAIEGLGRLLGPFEAETVSRNLTLPDAPTVVTISFDLYLWGQTAPPELLLSGTPVAMDTRLGDPAPGGQRRARMSARVNLPGGDIDLALVGATEGQWALDNLLVIAHGPDGA